MNTYTNQEAWKTIMSALPTDYHFTDDYKPVEEKWIWKNHKVHLDTFRNPSAAAKLICFHGVGTNGRQISLITGGPQAKAGFETIMIDMPTYGVTEVSDRNSVTYDDWVQLGSDYIDAELTKDNRPIFLYGLSAGGMETYHVATRNKKVKGIIGMTFLDQRISMVRETTANNRLSGKIGNFATGFVRKFGLGKLTTPIKQASKMITLVNNEKLLNIMMEDETSAGNMVSVNFLNSYMTYRPDIEAKDFDICPVLLTQPEKDRWTPLNLSKPTLDQITKVPVTIEILPNGGHYPVEPEALTVMNQTITQFITDLL